MKKITLYIASLATSALLCPLTVFGETPEEEEVFKNLPYTQIEIVEPENDIVQTKEQISINEEYRNKISKEDDEHIFTAVEEPAEFPGGQAAMMKWIASNIRYSEPDNENTTPRRVVVKIVVERDGTITNPVIVRSLEKECDQEALRVVSEMPVWSPGKMNGIPVRSYYILPVTFRVPNR